MGDFPSAGEYQEALQWPEEAFTDPLLQRALPEDGLLGLPRAITGAFAVVFPMSGGDRRWAVRCFLTDVPDQRVRYREVARHLASAAAQPAVPYTVPFDYQPRGLRVGGRALPLLKMGWAEGMTLNRYVAQYRDRPEVLAVLARRFAEMVAALETAHVAHGDLQHGNILVAGGGDPRLCLVDYDTVYVPGLKGRKSPEAGHRNYQHPDRAPADFGPYLDRFPALVIFTALRACAAEPSLWERFDTDENLLFRGSDFLDPKSAPVFEALAGISALRDELSVLRQSCFLAPREVPPLADVLAGRVDLPDAPRPGTKAAARASRRGAHRRRSVAGPWRMIVLSVLAIVTGASSAAAGVRWMGGVLLAGGIVGVVFAVWRDRRDPARLRRRRLRREVAYYDREVAALRRRLAAEEAARDRFLVSRENLRERRLQEVIERALEDRLKHHFISEAGAFDGITHKVVVRLKAGGIRTAAHVTPARMANVPDLGETSRARVMAWREALVARYMGEVPGTLSPAEERRLERVVQHRLAEMEETIERLRAKIRVQEAERGDVAARLGRPA